MVKWEGRRGHKDQGSTIEPRSAPNGTAQPCACQLPVNVCLQGPGSRVSEHIAQVCLAKVERLRAGHEEQVE